MGARGPAPRRDAERRRRNEPAGGAAQQIGEAELGALPFVVDFTPDPPAAKEHWHSTAKEFWEALQRDPARKWMTSADWAMAAVVAESMSRDLNPQVVGVTEEGGVVKDYVPLKGANLASYLKFMGMIGITESERLRLRKEITLFPPVQLAEVTPIGDIAEARAEDVQ